MRENAAIGRICGVAPAPVPGERFTITVPSPTMVKGVAIGVHRLMARVRCRWLPFTNCPPTVTEKSFETWCSTFRFACCTMGCWKFGCITKMVGGAAVPVVGAAQFGESTGAPHFVFGYDGTSVPVNVLVATLIPLFECAVPIKIEGVVP